MRSAPRASGRRRSTMTTIPNRTASTVGAYVAGRLASWEKRGKIEPKTAERQQELLANQIQPFHRRQAAAEIERGRYRAMGRPIGRRTGAAMARVACIRGRSCTRIACCPKRLRKRSRAGSWRATSRDECNSRCPCPAIRSRTNRAWSKPTAVRLPHGHGGVGNFTASCYCDLHGDAPAGSSLYSGSRSTLTCRFLHRSAASPGPDQGQGRLCQGSENPNSLRDITLPAHVAKVLRDHRRTEIEFRLANGLSRLTGEDIVFPNKAGCGARRVTSPATGARSRTPSASGGSRSTSCAIPTRANRSTAATSAWHRSPTG